MKTKVSTSLPKSTSPLRQVGGTEPYNEHFWARPEDWFHLDRLTDIRRSRFDFACVALEDGRFIAGGCVSTYSIDKNQDCYGRPVVYPTRAKALRADCARMIRLMRYSIKWNCPWDSLEGEELEKAINWALECCAKECNEPPPRPIRIWTKPPPRPAPLVASASPWDDL